MDDIIKILKNSIPLIDLRAPIEFNKGAFPSSINIPILNNNQRAEVGTKYKKQGNNAAEKLGFDLVKNQQNEIVYLWKKFIEENFDYTVNMFDKKAQESLDILKEEAIHETKTQDAQVEVVKESSDTPKSAVGFYAQELANMRL